MTELDTQALRGRALNIIAQYRSLVLSTYEMGFRDEFQYRKETDNKEITLIYARIDRESAQQDGFTIRVRVITEFSSLDSLKCIKDEPGKPVEPHHLADELHKYLRERAHNSGLLVLAIDRVHLLPGAKKRMLASLLYSIDQRFAVILLMPEQEWEFASTRNQYQFDEFAKVIPHKLRTTEDLKDFLIEHGDSIESEYNEELPF